MALKEEKVHSHSFVFGKDPGGESLHLKTEYFHNGDPVENRQGIFTNQKLTLNSYCNSASFNLNGTSLTSADLRKLADELYRADAEAREVARKRLAKNASIIASEAARKADIVFDDRGRIVKNRYGSMSKNNRNQIIKEAAKKIVTALFDEDGATDIGF